MPNGRSGKILFADLETERCRTEDTARYADLVGGRSINQRILFDLQAPGADAFDPANPVVLGAGPLVGTLVPAACRLAIDFRNVITGGVGSANLGGHFAAEMKFAGYDHIVIQGQAHRPVYLYITPEKVVFRDAGTLWGHTTWETENRIKTLENDARIKTLTIGPAGENRVRFACIIGDRGRAAGYGGAGALFGSKNLKAVAVRGGRSLRVAQPEALLAELERFNRDVIEKSRFVRIHREGGTLNAYLLPGEKRPHAVRNMSAAFWDDAAISKVDRQTIDARYLVRRHSCFACPVYGSAIYRIDDAVCEGLQANSWRAFASNLAITNPEQVLRLHSQANLAGLDGDHCSAVLAWAVECFEKGLIDTRDTEGLVLRWGDGASAGQLMSQIVRREGFGAVLAEGLSAAARTVGRGTERLAVVTKDNALMEAAMRSHKGWALGIITSTKGGGHLRGAPAVEAMRIPPEISRQHFGLDDIQDPTAYMNKAELVTWYENYKGVVDMMGVCYLPTMWMEIGLYTPEDIARFHCMVTGEEKEADALMRAGSRLQNLETLFNILHAGFGRSDMQPPEKLSRIPVEDGPFKGERLDPECWQTMLDAYYRAHGWDTASGWPTIQCLHALGLQKDAERLRRHGIALPEAAAKRGDTPCR